MEVNEILSILEEMNVAVISTADENNQPHARHIHIGVANEKGVFFMTSPKTNFYKQLQKNPKVAITAMKSEDYLIQVIRIEGVVKEIGRERLEEVLKDNNEEDIAGVQVFHLYEGKGFYHSLTQGHKYVFDIHE